MIRTNIFFIFLLCFLLTACNKNDDFLTEENPSTKVIEMDGHDFIIKGDIDGEDFVIHHESTVQYNSPVNDDQSNSGRPFFGSSFTIEDSGPELYKVHIVFGLTENGNTKFEDIFRVGTYDWFNHSYPTQSVGEATINQLIFNGYDMTNSTIPDNNPNNYFEITSITPLELDINLDEVYSGKLYKVEGHFAIDLEKWDNSGDTPRLTVEYFSAIFYDNSL